MSHGRDKRKRAKKKAEKRKGVAAQSHRAPPISSERNAEIAQLFLGAVNAQG